MTRVLRMWTDPDPGARRDTLEQLFVIDARFNDIDGEFIGHEGLERKAGVDACLDTAGLASRALDCVRDGGSFATSVVPAWFLGALHDGARGISPSRVEVKPDADATAQLADLAARGELTLRVAETVPFERFRDAYTSLERGGLWGKIVLTP